MQRLKAAPYLAFSLLLNFKLASFVSEGDLELSDAEGLLIGEHLNAQVLVGYGTPNLLHGLPFSLLARNS